MTRDAGIVFCTLNSDAGITNVRTISRASIGACRFLILVPDHYRVDGSCKCDDPAHRKTMIAEWGYTRASFKGIPLRRPWRAEWIDLGSDVNWIDHGGSWGCKAPDGSWYVLQWTDMHDATGETSGDRWIAEVRRVNLAEVPPRELEQALGSFDLDSDAGEIERVGACNSYGIYAPLENFWGSKYAERIRASAKRYALGLMTDASALDSALDRPVNRIGTTAREFGRGDISAGLRRYEQAPSGDPTMDLMLKIERGGK